MSRQENFGLGRLGDTSRGRAMDAQAVSGVTPDHTDEQIAVAAGYSKDKYPFGYHVHRAEDENAATVRLWRD